MMTWRLAESLIALRAEINEAWPARNKASDGTIGNAAHQARQSDHNPNAAGVVTAFDITHDPDGPQLGLLAEHFRALGKAGDKRVKYVICNRRIASGTTKPGYPPWSWRPYDGANAHDKHTHLSVSADWRWYDSQVPWRIEELIDMPTAAEIANAVWAHQLPDPYNGKMGPAGSHLRWATKGAYADLRASLASLPTRVADEVMERLGSSTAGATREDVEAVVAEALAPFRSLLPGE